MQWMPPPHSKIGRASTSTTSRLGYRSAQDRGGRIVARIVERAQDDRAVADVVVDVRPVDDALVGVRGVSAPGSRRPPGGGREHRSIARRSSAIVLAHLVVGMRRVGLRRGRPRGPDARRRRRCRRGRGCRTARSPWSDPAAARSPCATPRCGLQLRLDLRRHPSPGCGAGRAARSRVIITVPSPSTWMPPPSLTIGEREHLGAGQAGGKRADVLLVVPACRSPVAPQPLKRQCDGTEPAIRMR